MKAIIFDFDGVILDTETPSFESWCALYEERGLTLALSDWHCGVGTRDGFDPFAPFDPGEHEKIRARRMQWVTARLQGARPRPGIEPLIKAAHGRGIRMGVASSSGSAWVETWLLKLGFRDYFECVCTRERVKQVKPDPALYQLALCDLGIHPGDAIAIEDSAHGAAAALAAGLRCYVFPNSVTASMRFPEQAVLIDALDGVLTA